MWSFCDCSVKSPPPDASESSDSLQLEGTVMCHSSHSVPNHSSVWRAQIQSYKCINQPLNITCFHMKNIFFFKQLLQRPFKSALQLPSHWIFSTHTALEADGEDANQTQIDVTQQTNVSHCHLWMPSSLQMVCDKPVNHNNYYTQHPLICSCLSSSCFKLLGWFFRWFKGQTWHFLFSSKSYDVPDHPLYIQTLLLMSA